MNPALRTCAAAALALTSAFSAVACTTNTTSPAAPRSASTAAPSPTPLNTLGPDVAGSASAPAQRIVADTRGTLGLQDAEAACLAQRLDRDPPLRDALSTNPQSSPRWQTYNDLAADCIRTTTGATNFANGIQAQAAGTLSPEELSCLRDNYAKLTNDDTAAFVRNGLNPGSIDRNVQQKLIDLLAACHVDTSALSPLPGGPPTS